MNVRRSILRTWLAVPLLVLLPVRATAQPPVGADPLLTAQSGSPEGPKGKDPEAAHQDHAQATGGSDDRLFWTLPNFLTVENLEHAPPPPLTRRQKFAIVARGSFDPVEYPWYGFLAGVGQVERSEPQFGLGAKGYAKRFGTAFGDGTIDNFMVGALFPSLLREDPRYYQLGKGGVWRRTGYALSRLIITRTDARHSRFNFSEIVGSAVTAGLSNTYHPPGDRTLANTGSVWWTQIGYDALANLAKEFWPDIRRRATRH